MQTGCLIVAALLCATAGSGCDGDSTAKRDEYTYIAFHISDREDLGKLTKAVGGRGNPKGHHRLAVSAHLNPLGNKYTGSAPDFRIDEEKLKKKLEFIADTGLPVSLGIFAGKFFTSDATGYLRETKTYLMWDQHGEPITIDYRRGGTYFAISPSGDGLPRNEFLKLYERNVRDVARIVAAWMKKNPGRVVGVSFAGEIKYPPAKIKVKGKKAARRWADYGPFALARFREYARKKAGGDLGDFVKKMGLPEKTFASFSELDPPRGTGRGGWDTLDDPSNPYFLFWYGFRVEEVKHHIRETVRWGREEGIAEDATTRIYSHQAIWDQDSENHYWRGAPLETLELPGINPVVSMYGEKTADAEFIGRVGAVAGRARGVGAPLTVRLERETLEGTFVGLDGDGALLLQDADGRRRFPASLTRTRDLIPCVTPCGVVARRAEHPREHS